jgi:hypothetical protein
VLVMVRSGGVRRIIVAVMLLVVAGGVVASPRWARAQQTAGWLIVPGKSWGPLSIGDTENKVKSILGAPEDRKDTEFDSIWTYRTAQVFLIREGLDAPANSPMKVWLIVVWDPAAVTREGVRIGARLQDVLRVYGDSRDNLKTTGHQPSGVPTRSDCLNISTYAQTATGSGTRLSYEFPEIAFHYLDRGVTFELQSEAGPNGAFTVITIDVEAPSACRPQP